MHACEKVADAGDGRAGILADFAGLGFPVARVDAVEKVLGVDRHGQVVFVAARRKVDCDMELENTVPIRARV